MVTWHSAFFASISEHNSRITLPKESEWGGWAFKHPEKLLRRHPSEQCVEIRFHDNWTFRLYHKNGETWERETLNAKEFLEHYSDEHRNFSEHWESYYRETIPETLKPVKTKPHDDLTY